MKILLINSPPLIRVGVTGQMYPPLGILYLAGYIREKIPDLNIQVHDGYIEKRKTLLNKIYEFNPDIIGISYATQSATGAYDLINEIRELKKEVLIVVGGPHATIFPEEALKRSKSDIVVIGEGEETFFQIVKNVKNNSNYRNIDGTYYRNEGKIIKNPIRPYLKDLDQVPFPARDLVDLSKYSGYLYKKTNQDTSIISSRGCPFNCVYCSNPVWNYQNPRYRQRSPENIVDEIEYIIKNFHIYEFFDQADEFNNDLKWAKNVCKEIIKRDLNISFKVQMRIDNVDDELASLFKDSGMILGYFGIESGNARTLKGINKKQDLEQVESALNIMKRNNLKTCGLFMAFNVWEEDGDLKFEDKNDTLKTLEYIKYLLKQKKIDYFTWSMTTPYPGSKLFNIAVNHNLIPGNLLNEWEFYDAGNNFLMKLPGISRKDWRKIFFKGKRIQLLLFLRRGLFKTKTLPLYIRKISFYLKSTFLRN